jgi:hypothetical protein
MALLAILAPARIVRPLGVAEDKMMIWMLG